MAFDVDKFIKVVGMTGSMGDGECLNAARKANAMLAEANLTWEDVVRGKWRNMPPDPRYTAPPWGGPDQFQTGGGYRPRDTDAFGDPRRYDGPEVEEMITQLMNTVSAASSFRGFVESIAAFYERAGFVTEKQYQALRRSCRR